MRSINPVNHWIKTHGDLALDLIRIYLGIGLFAKAIFFMNHSDYINQLVDSAGSLWFAPAMLVHYLLFAHFCGGILLAFGLFTRTAALIQLPVLFTALFYLHMPRMITSIESRQNVEFTGLVSFLLIIIAIYGAGRLSLDYWLARRESARLFQTGPLVSRAA